MVLESEFKEFADIAIQEIEDFIDTDKKMLKEEHMLIDKTASLEYILMHLSETLLEPKLVNLIDEITLQITQIRNLLEKNEKTRIKFLREEEHIIRITSKELRHKHWRIVHVLKKDEKKIAKKEERIETKFIFYLSLLFNELLQISETALRKTKGTGIDKYFRAIYNFARTYENVFQHLYRKEEELLKILEK